jgi:hypothetical protein
VLGNLKILGVGRYLLGLYNVMDHLTFGVVGMLRPGISLFLCFGGMSERREETYPWSSPVEFGKYPASKF